MSYNEESGGVERRTMNDACLCFNLKPIDVREKNMTENKYRVVLTGALAEGNSENDVTARMATLFKTSTDRAGMLLKKQGAVIKKDLDLATAKRYASAMLATGAVCKIDTPEKEAVPVVAEVAPVDTGELSPPADVVAPEEDNGRAATPGGCDYALEKGRRPV